MTKTLEFDWDKENKGHLARHGVSPAEAEAVHLNRPVDLDLYLRIGETNAGRIVVVVSTMRGKKVRVITAWPANERLRRYFQTQKRNGNVGRAEEQDVRK